MDIKKVQKNIGHLKILIVLSQLSFHVPIWIIYFMSKGISLTQVASLYAILLITQLIMEVPSGILGDRIGQKSTLTIAGIAKTLSFIGFIIFGSFPLLVIAMILSGIGNAMQSGSDSSLLYDSLKLLHKEMSFKIIYGKCNGYMFRGRAASALIGGSLYVINPILPFLLDIISQISYTFISSLLFDKFVKRVRSSWKNTITSLQSSYKQAFTMKEFAKIFVFSALIGSIAKVTLYQYTQPYLEFIQINIVWFGVIFAIFNLISGLGSLYANKLGKLFSIDKYLILHGLVFGLFLFFLSDISFIVGALLILGVLFFLMGLYAPTVSTYINEKVDSKNRTTMLSINAQIYNIFASLLIFGTGFLSSILSIFTALGIMSFILLFLYVLSVRHVKAD